MIYRVSADLLVILHLCYVLFVLIGGWLIIKWRRLIWLHLPAVIWGALVEFADWYCPLTTWENWLHQKGAEAGYSTDFIQHYLLAALYPDFLNRGVQILLGALVIGVNGIFYGLWLKSQFKSPSRR